MICGLCGEPIFNREYRIENIDGKKQAVHVECWDDAWDEAHEELEEKIDNEESE